MPVDFSRYYDLETYLFEDVHLRFHRDGYLSAFDFFSIVIWKANRAKTLVARRLLIKAQTEELDSAVRLLSHSIYLADTMRERLRILLDDWGFHLPMASAILTVLWPDFFTVYDIRACEQLGRFRELANRTRFEKIWAQYIMFRDAVAEAGPDGTSLRDKDRYLWAKSSASQLDEDIARCFVKPGLPLSSTDEPKQ
jgi:hypothetical protein